MVAVIVALIGGMFIPPIGPPAQVRPSTIELNPAATIDYSQIIDMRPHHNHILNIIFGKDLRS